MLRRSRISVRPNVRPAGRGPTPGGSQDSGQPVQEAPDPHPQDSDLSRIVTQDSDSHPQDSDPSRIVTQDSDPSRIVTQDSDSHPQDSDPSRAEGKEEPATTAGTEKAPEPSTPGKDEKDPSAEASTSGAPPSAGPQRRKRYSVMPNLAKPRAAPALTRSSPRTPRSPGRAASETPGPVSSAPDPEPSGQTNAVPHGLRSPRRRRPSGGARQPRAPPPGPHPPSSPASPDPAASPLEERADQEAGPPQPAHADATAPAVSEVPSAPSTSQAPPTEEAPPTTALSEKAPPSLPSREASEMSERAQTLVSRSVKSGLSLAPGKSRLSRLLNDPTDLQRLAKARKLRELLRQEMNREKKTKKPCLRECIVDPSKMTMRDLIYYLPDSNPMTSFTEDKQKEAEIVVPPSPSRDESPEGAQEAEEQPEPASRREEEEEEEEEDEEEGEAGQDDQLMVPRVKVAEDGSLIIDEESLTVRVNRAKGPNLAEERDPIFERGSTTTYSSFRKGCHTKPWSSQETDMFFLAINMVGTDFSMIGQLFPHRARTEIKNKFKKEERQNSWRIDKAFKERRRLDLEFFTKLLEKILAVAEKKKSKSPAERKVARKRSRKPKAKKATKTLSDVEEEEEEEEDARMEGEKENEGASNEEETAGAPPKKKRKRKDGGESSPEKTKSGKRTGEQDEASVPGDSEAALPEDQSPAERPEEAEEPAPAAKGPVIKPAQLARGRAQRPLPTLGRKWGQKGPAPPCTKPREDAPPAGEDSPQDGGTPKEQVDEDAAPSPSKGQDEEKQADDVTSSEGEEESCVRPAKRTRYGRLPKPPQHLNYPAKDSEAAPASNAAPGSSSPAAPSPSSSSSSPSSKPRPPTRRAKLRPGPSLARKESASSPKKPKLVTLWASRSESEGEEGEGGGEDEGEEDVGPEGDNQAPAFVPLGLRSPEPMTREVEETMEELNISVNVPDVLGIPQNALCLDAACEQAHGEPGAVPCEHQLDLLVDVIEFLSPEHVEVSQESYNEAARTLLTIGSQAPLSQETQDDVSEALVAEAQLATEDAPSQSQQSEMTPELADQSQSSTAPPEPADQSQCSTALPETSDQSQSSTAPPETSDRSRSSTALPETSDQSQSSTAPPETSDQSQSSTAPPETSDQSQSSTALPVTSDPCSVASARPIEESEGSVPTQWEGPPSTNENGGGIGPPPRADSGSDGSEPPASQTRRSRFPKLRPKPNLVRASRTAQSKPSPEESTVTKTTSPEPEPEPKPSRTTQSKPPSAGETSSSPSEPAEDIATHSKPEPSEEMTSVSLPAVATTSSEPQPKPNLARASRTTQSKPPPAGESRTQVPPEESTSTVTTSPEPQPQPKPNLGLRPKPNLGRFSRTTQSKPPPEESTSTATTSPEPEPQPKPKPNLAQASRTTQSKPPPAGESSTQVPPESASTATTSPEPQPQPNLGLRPKPNPERASRTAQSKPPPVESASTAPPSPEQQPTEGTTTPSEPQPVQRTDPTDRSEAPRSTQNTEHPGPGSYGGTVTSTSISTSASAAPEPAPAPPRSVETTATSRPAVTEAPGITRTRGPIAAAADSDPSARRTDDDGPVSDVAPAEAAASVDLEKAGEVGPSAPRAESASDGSEPTASQTRRSRFARVRPKPNLVRASRTTQSKPSPEESTVTMTTSPEPEPQPKPNLGLRPKPNLGSFSRTTRSKPPPEESTSTATTSPEPEPQPNPSRTTQPKTPSVGETTSSSTAPSECTPAEDIATPSEPEPSEEMTSASLPAPSSSPRPGPLPEPQRRENTAAPTPLSIPDRHGSPQEGSALVKSSPEEEKEGEEGGGRGRGGLDGEAQRGPPLPAAAGASRAKASDPDGGGGADGGSRRGGVRRARICKPNLGRGGRAPKTPTQPEPGPSAKKTTTLGDLAALILDDSKVPSRKPKRPLGGARAPPEKPAQTQTQPEESSAGDSSPPTACPPPPTPCPPTASPPTALPPTALPPTALPPTALPPTALPPTALPPTALLPTPCLPTPCPPTPFPPTASPPPPTPSPPTQTPGGAEESQAASVSRVEESQPTTTIIIPDSGVLSVDQCPSDPEEPFFILSLTEIPLYPPGEDMARPPPDDPAPDPARSQPHSVMDVGETVVGGEPGDREPDPRSGAGAACTSGDPVPGESEEQRDETETPGKGSLNSGRAEAELQAKPSTQPSPAQPPSLGTGTSGEREPGEPGGGGATGLPDLPDRTGEEETEDGGGSGAESQPVRGITPLTTNSPLSRPGRRPRGFLSFMADKGSLAPTGLAKAASQKPQPKASRRGRTRCAPVLTSSTRTSTTPPEVEASESPDVSTSRTHPEPGVSKQTEPSTSLSATAAEGSGSQQGEEEEANNVSQFFFGDIFTEVEESGEVSRNVKSTPQLQHLREGQLPAGADQGSLAPTGPAKAASQKPQPKASRRGRTRCAPVLTSSTRTTTTPPEVETSESPDVSTSRTHPEPGVSKLTEPSTSLSSTAAEVAGSQQGEEEEANNVSQFFFGDIFTEVEESGEVSSNVQSTPRLQHLGEGQLPAGADQGSLAPTGLAKAASQKPQPKASRRGRTRCAPVLTSSTRTTTTPPEVEASESPDVSTSRTHPEPGVSKLTEPSTSLSSTAAEVAGSQQGEEEEANVSQFFFGDIFTEVEESGEVSRNVQSTPQLQRLGEGQLPAGADQGSLAPTGLAKAASQKPQPKASRRGRTRCAPVLTSSTRTTTTPPEVEASESPDVSTSRTHPEPGVSKLTEPSTSLSSTTAEVAGSQQGEEEEANNVSQFFFGDIFTEVEESGEVSSNVQSTPQLQRLGEGQLPAGADKGSLAPTGLAKAASQKPQPKASRRGRTRCAPVLTSSTKTTTTPPEVEASESPDVSTSRTHPEPGVSKLTEPCTSLCATAAEVAGSQQGEEEEANNVSQFFFNDIFTEVEES